MGLDIHYQAMPPNCSILELARHNGEFGSCLEFFNNYAHIHPSRLDNYADDDVVLHFIIETKRVIQNHLELEDRNYSASRHWDMLHYLLSAKRREGDSQNEGDWVKRAIRGGDILNPQTQTTIGSPILYLASDETREIAVRLNAVSPDDLRRHWNVTAMLEAAVYKSHPEDNEDTLAWIITFHRQLADFHKLVAQHNEGVVTCLG